MSQDREVLIPCEGQAVVSYGCYFQVQDPNDSEWLYLAGLTDFDGPQTSRAEIDATRLCSTAKENVLDLKEHGTISATVQTMLGTRSQRLMMEGLNETDTYNFRLVLRDDGLGNGAVICEFKGRVQAFPISGAQGSILTSALTIRITGDLAWQFPGDLGKHLQFSQFTMSEAAQNDGRVSGVVSVVVFDDAFAGDDGDTLPVTFTGVPDGLTARAVKANEYTAVINFNGAATDHTAGTRAAVGVTFLDAAFASGSAADVVNASGKTITIKFI